MKVMAELTDVERFKREYQQQWDIDDILPEMCPVCQKKFNFWIWSREKVKAHIVKCMMRNKK